MSDLISRSAAVKALRNVMCGECPGISCNECWYGRYIKEVEDLPDAQPDSEWVSVNDRLPDESGHYFTYSRVMGVYPYEFSKIHGLFNCLDRNDKATAKLYSIPVDYWCPRPNPPKT